MKQRHFKIDVNSFFFHCNTACVWLMASCAFNSLGKTDLRPAMSKKNKMFEDKLSNIGFLITFKICSV